MPPPTERLDLARTAPADALARALEALEQGELVGVPTETVYCVVARADAAGVQRLAALAPRGRRTCWLAGSAADLGRSSAVAHRIAARYWPGPLTLVLPAPSGELTALAEQGALAVRCAADPLCAELVRRAPFPLAAVETERDAEALLASDGSRIALVLDAGPSRIGEPSVELELLPGRFRVVREGLIDAASLRRTAGLEIAFVCTGNTCRSPMAEGIARARIAESLGLAPERIGEFGFGVRSMGVHASPGEPASAHAVATLREQKIDISGHRAHSALPDTIASMDRVYALTRSHLEALRATLPPGKDRHCELLDPDGRDIADPIGGPRSAYEATAAQIRRAIERRLVEWV